MFTVSIYKQIYSLACQVLVGVEREAPMKALRTALTLGLGKPQEVSGGDVTFQPCLLKFLCPANLHHCIARIPSFLCSLPSLVI